MRNNCFLLMFVLFSCVENSDYSVPDIICIEPELKTTHTIQQIKEMVGFGLKEFTDEVIISGYIVTSDEKGNFYKSLYLQDKNENPTAAIKVVLDLANYYTKYPFGRKVFVRLKGLSVASLYGVPTIGKAIGGDLERIPNILIKEHIFRSCETATVYAKKVTVSELNEMHVGMFLKFENIQLKNSNEALTYANVDDTKSVEIEFEQFTESCVSKGILLLQTSGFSRFKSNSIPNLKGNLTAVLDKYYSSFYVKINDTNNVQFELNRCESSAEIKSNISITEMINLYKLKTVEFGVNENLIIEGYVISSDEEKNIQNKIVIQDAIENPKAGVQILINKENYFQSFTLGEKVYIRLDKLYLDKVDGKYTIGVYEDDSVGEIEEEDMQDFFMQTDSIFNIIPKDFFVKELESINMGLMFVKLKNVQLSNSDYGRAFAYYSGKESANRFIETCGEINKISVLTNGEAVFANKQFPVGQGSVTGVFSYNDSGFELQMNHGNDISFFEEYQECPEIIPQVLITEIADPKNSVSARFVELYNSGDSEINLSGWKLNKYINGSTKVSSTGLVLQGSIKSKDFFVIANTGFRDVFGFDSDLESSYISGNGDDVYELVDAEGTRQDLFGEVGVDGTGKIWEYADGRAARELHINRPNEFFEDSEWSIYSIAKESEKNAPQDYTPYQR